MSWAVAFRVRPYLKGSLRVLPLAAGVVGVATFTFAYGLLRRIEDDSVPHLGVTAAGVAVGASLMLLLLYLDTVRPDRRPAVRPEIAALDVLGKRSFSDPALRAYAAGCDRQGLGGTRFVRAGTGAPGAP
jgi:hypothetical protein